MKLKLICYLKSGAVVSDEVEFADDATIEDAVDARVSVKNFVNNAIKNHRLIVTLRKINIKGFNLKCNK